MLMYYLIYIGSYMSAHVLLNLYRILNECSCIIDFLDDLARVLMYY